MAIGKLNLGKAQGMEWIPNGDVLESGPYVIELSRPGHWVLTRTEDSGGSLVRPETEWSARSLRQLKAVAESIESRHEGRLSLRLHLSVLVGSVFILIGAAGGSGRVAAMVAITSAGLVLYAISRVIDQWRRRPWDDIRHRYQ